MPIAHLTQWVQMKFESLLLACCSDCLFPWIWKRWPGRSCAMLAQAKPTRQGRTYNAHFAFESAGRGG